MYDPLKYSSGFSSASGREKGGSPIDAKPLQYQIAAFSPDAVSVVVSAASVPEATISSVVAIGERLSDGF